MAQTLFHPASTRFHAAYGWLDAYRSFSSSASDPSRRRAFGALQVLNNDTVTAGQGFGTHPHQQMEIITIPLAGALQHQDSLGHQVVIGPHEVQLMSAGTGIAHSERNHSAKQPVNFLQIWLTTDQPQAAPRYDQQYFAPENQHNQLLQVASPVPEDAGVWLRQQAWLYLGSFDAAFATTYQVKRPGNGVYVLVLQGEITIDGRVLRQHDGLGSWDVDAIHLQAATPAEVLVLDVPMQA
jgi:redox-sensitive bicupin YhaK (pirin superfamily)